MIARKAFLSISIQILNGIFGYVGLFFISKYMTPEEYGIFAFALGYVTIFRIFTDFGLNQTHIRKISEKINFEQRLGAFITIKIILTIGTTLLIVSSILIWKLLFGRGFETAQHEFAVYIMIFYLIIISIKSCFEITFKAQKKIALVSSSQFFNNLARLILLIFVALSGYGVFALTTTYIFGEIVAISLLIYYFKGIKIKKPDRNHIKDYIAYAWPLAIVPASVIIMTNIDKILIQLFWNAEDVGYYFSTFRLTNFINLFTQALGALLLPTYVHFHTNKKMDHIKKLTHTSERYISMIVFPMVFGIVVLAEPATRILLNGWMPVVPILSIMPFYTLFASLEIPYKTQFIGTNNPKFTRNNVLIMVFTNVILNILLIPKDISSIGFSGAGLGARGAAIATVISYALGLTYSRVKVYQLTGLTSNKRIMIHALAATGMAGFLYYLITYQNMMPQRWFTLLLLSLLGLAIYLIILRIFNEFTREDFYFLVDTLNVKKMIDYIKGELKGK